MRNVVLWLFSLWYRMIRRSFWNTADALPCLALPHSSVYLCAALPRDVASDVRELLDALQVLLPDHSVRVVIRPTLPVTSGLMRHDIYTVEPRPTFGAIIGPNNVFSL